MTLKKATLFAAGYVIGARAGRERYDQIVGAAAKVSQRLEEFSARRPPGRQGESSSGAERGS